MQNVNPSSEVSTLSSMTGRGKDLFISLHCFAVPLFAEDASLALTLHPLYLVVQNQGHIACFCSPPDR
jgi:hypothetical protein